jgi:hypothetical protein
MFFFFDNYIFDILPREPALHTFPPSLGGLILLNDIVKYIEQFAVKLMNGKERKKMVPCIQ